MTSTIQVVAGDNPYPFCLVTFVCDGVQFDVEYLFLSGTTEALLFHVGVAVISA